MGTTKSLLINIATLLITSFVLLGCSKDDGEFELNVNFEVIISPKGAGTVETSVSYVNSGVYFIKLTAIPSAGFSFSYWERPANCLETENPCSFGLQSYYFPETITMSVKAVFENME